MWAGATRLRGAWFRGGPTSRRGGCGFVSRWPLCDVGVRCAAPRFGGSLLCQESGGKVSASPRAGASSERPAREFVLPLRPAKRRRGRGPLHLMAERYERRSLLISSNLVFGEWGKMPWLKRTMAWSPPTSIHLATTCMVDVHHQAPASAQGHRVRAARHRHHGRSSDCRQRCAHVGVGRCARGQPNRRRVACIYGGVGFARRSASHIAGSYFGLAVAAVDDASQIRAALVRARHRAAG